MFEDRLRWFCIALGLLALLLVGRLVQIQVIEAADFEALSQQMLAGPIRYLETIRGSIRDRNGALLVSDQPTSDVSVHYAFLAGRSDLLRRWAVQLRRQGRFPADARLADISDALRVSIGETWKELSELTGVPVSELVARAERIGERVERIRAAVARRTGIEQPIAEESAWHPLVTSVPETLAIEVRTRLAPLPWVRVEPGSRRTAHDADDLVHILGRTSAVSAEQLDADPLRDDELRRLRATDLAGSSGVERAAETVLRGTRGRAAFTLSGEADRIEPLAGGDVYLSIDRRLQRGALEILERAVRESPHPSGAAAVVIDVATREVLVLASYPTYGYDELGERFSELQADQIRAPLLFRAVSGQFPPGSTCKAITLYGGLADGRITPGERISCTGYLLPTMQSAFRCWIFNQYPGVTHDMDEPRGQDAELAIRNSCNIYFFKLGERLGPERLCDWFDRFGLGRLQGSGLAEEADGVVPTVEWLRARQNREYERADAWNFSIGQGEVTITPLQAANVAAAIARGRWEPVRLMRTGGGEWLLGEHRPGDEYNPNLLQPLRAGMWRVVNETGGSAVQARLETPGSVLCGKTGSAQVAPRSIARRYTLEWPDGRREEVIATSRESAYEKLGAGPEVRLAGYVTVERYPEIGEDGKLPAHAWFIGYTQSADTPKGGAPLGAMIGETGNAAPRGRCYAIAVLVEFGGSGGRVAGPPAKAIAEMLLSGP